MLSTFNELAVKEKIGTGTFGFVHRAESASGENFALKVIKQTDLKTQQEALEMAENEFSIHSVLSHKNIVNCLRKT